MRHARVYRRGSGVKTGLFFGLLGILLALSFVLPLRPTSSPREKRERLTEFPEFSTEALLSGEYFRGIDAWFSDTYPGRNELILFNEQLQRLYGIRTTEIHGAVETGDDIPDTPFAG